MKIVLYAHTLRRGGMERVLVLLAEQMKASGHDVHIVAMQGPVEYKEVFKRANLSFSLLYPAEIPFFWANLFQAARKLRSEFRRISPDAMIVWGGQAAIIARIAGIRWSIYAAQNSSGVHWKSYRPGHILLSILERWALSAKSLIVVACSISTAHAYSKRFSISPSRFHIIANSIDLKSFCRPIGKRDQSKLKILCVGTLYFQKNFEMALRSLKLLRDRGIDAQLDIVGDGPDRSKLEGLVERLGLQESVSLLGSRDDVPNLMTESDIFWFTSRYEGFGLVAVEAMASGLPVIATRVQGIVDVVIDGVNGCLVDLDDDHALVESTIKLLVDPSFRSEIVSNGIHCATVDYSPQVMTEKYLKVLDLCA